MRLLVLFLFLLHHTILIAQSESEWKLAKDKKDIKVYTRQSEGSKFKEFRAIITVKAPISSLLSVIRKVEEYPNWVPDLKSSIELKKVSDNERYYYAELNLPWPFNNRDVITHQQITDNGSTAEVLMNGKPDYIEEKKGIVRMPTANGRWYFEDQKNGVTKIIYEFIADPAGSIPAWVVNMFIVDGPYKTLINLREMVEK